MSDVAVLFVSSFCSDNHYTWIKSVRTKESLDPAQRMFKGLFEGLASQGCQVTCITAMPVGASSTKQSAFKKEVEVFGTSKFIYLGFRVGKIKRLLDLYHNTKPEIVEWIKETEGRERVVICDSLIAMCTIRTRGIAQKKGIKTFAYVTDYPSMATSIKKRESFIKRILQTSFDKVADTDLKKYNGYILVADRLKELIPVKNKPYIVVEDIISVPTERKKCQDKDDGVFRIIYAGALCERFGINKLVDAIALIKNDKIEMLFYGSGESVDYIKQKGKEDSRICYGGVLAFNDLQEEQRKADLLINPRPTDETFVAYSFPSKTLSYMLSGVPVLSTRIPGIPKSYDPYLFWMYNEDIQPMADRINEITQLHKDELKEKGEKAYIYVTTEKNSERQSQRIIRFVMGEIDE